MVKVEVNPHLNEAMMDDQIEIETENHLEDVDQGKFLIKAIFFYCVKYFDIIIYVNSCVEIF